jgi:phage terminase large subunit-like protein
MATENAPRDQNYNTVIQGVDLTTGRLATNIYVDETTHRMLVQASVTMPTGQGKTLLFATISGAAGTTTIVTAQGAGLKIKVVSYAFTLSLAGTAKFTDGTPTDLTGAFDIGATGGAVAVGQPSNHLFETAANQSLTIITTVGAPKGHISYIAET